MNLIFIILFFFSNSTSAKNLKAEIDYSIFYKNQDSIELCIYYEFQSDNLTYHKNESSIFQSKIIFNAKFKSILNSYNINWELSSIESDISLNRIIFGLNNIILPKQQYGLDLKYHLENDTTISNSQKFKIIPKQNNYHLSDILFATRITHKDSSQINWDKKFLKGDYYLIPNASKQFFSDRPVLLSYFEIYGLDDIEENSFTLKINILDAVNKIKKTNIKNFKISDTNYYKEYLNFPIQELATGVYYLEINLLTKNGNQLLEKVIDKFFFLNFDKEPELTAKFTEDELFERSEYITLDEKTVKREYDKIKYIMTKAEQVRWEELDDLKAKQRALFHFWRVRDTDTTTQYNEAKQEFDKAVQYANEYYTFIKGFEGWRTDRGRVLLKYGFPMVVERFERRGEQVPCEVWYYGESGGGAYFYFVDKFGNNNFLLVHSTVFGENQNENWIQEYNPAITNFNNIKGSNQNSR